MEFLPEDFITDPFGLVYTILIIIWGVIIYKYQRSIIANSEYKTYRKKQLIRLVADGVLYGYCVFMISVVNPNPLYHLIVALPLYVYLIYLNYKTYNISEDVFDEKRKQIFNH